MLGDLFRSPAQNGSRFRAGDEEEKIGFARRSNENVLILLKYY